MQAQLVLLAGRSGKRQRRGELAPRLRRVETKEIDRLADFENRVDQGLPSLADAQRQQLLAMLLVEISGAVEPLGAGLAAQRVPVGLRGVGGTDHAVDI